MKYLITLCFLLLAVSLFAQSVVPPMPQITLDEMKKALGEWQWCQMNNDALMKDRKTLEAKIIELDGENRKLKEQLKQYEKPAQ